MIPISYAYFAGAMITAGKPNTTWVTTMMIASQLLLMLFTGNWLYTQYEKEKDRLSKDIKQALLTTSKELSDSSLYMKLVSPLLKTRGARVFKDSTVNDGAGHTKVIRSVMLMTADSTMSKAIMENNAKIPSVHKIHLEQNDSIILNMNGMLGSQDRFVIKSDTATEMLKSIMPVLIKQVMVSAGISAQDTFFSIDTNTLRKHFSQVAKKNGWSFKTVWINDDRRVRPNQDIVITIETNPNGRKMLVEGYRWQLLKSISPQILFVLLLLMLTGFSFVFAYRSLRKQMLLSAMKNDFISNMSHELKTPIATVKVALEALDNFNRVNDPEKTRDYIKMANIEMTRLDMLVNQALNTSLLEAGKIVLQMQSLDVQQLVSETAAIFKYRLQQSGGAIDLSFAGDNFLASIDKIHFQGVLINILDNSLKYSDKTPVIHIATKATTNHISINIKDNGPGIPQEYIKNVFDKFFRVPAGDTHNVKGYGLGLSYAKQVVELHYGTINVRNLPEGGCVFTIDIPKSHL